MRDKRPVDELSIEELERILMVRKREARIQRFRGDAAPPPPVAAIPAPQAPSKAMEAPPAIQAPIVNTAVEVPRFEDEAPVKVDNDPVPHFEDTAVDGDYEEIPRWMGGVFSKLMLVVEIGAVIGLAAILFLAYQALSTANNNVARTGALSATSEAELRLRQIRPTATPLISVQQVVLPGGHVWSETGQHAFNYSEVPGPYRDAFVSQVNAPRETIAPIPEGGPITLRIPKIDIEATIRGGDDWISLQAGVGHHPGSGNPGVQGNMILTGHNDIYGEIFKRINELEPGDEIQVQSTTGQWYTYVVQEQQIVDPSEVWVLDQNIGQEIPFITLISCYPYRVNTQRIVVFAGLVS
jgi:sortase A